MLKLYKLKSTPLPNVDDLPIKPTDINKLEWLASAKDVSNTLQQLYMQTLADSKLQTKILQILSNNSFDTFDITTTNLKFLGFKEGSEPGVLSYAYLFETKQHHFGSLVLIWNNENNLLNREIFSEIAHGILKLLDKF